MEHPDGFAPDALSQGLAPRGSEAGGPGVGRHPPHPSRVPRRAVPVRHRAGRQTPAGGLAPMRRRFLAAVLIFSLCAAVPAQQQAAGHRREGNDANAAGLRREGDDANAAGHRREGDDANPPERVRQFAALPNWTGVWETELSAQLNSGELDKAMAEAVRHPERNTTVLAPKGVLHPAETLFFSRMQLIREPPYNPEWQRRYERLSQKIRQDELTIE